jgi:hypothetical protein
MGVPWLVRREASRSLPRLATYASELAAKTEPEGPGQRPVRSTPIMQAFQVPLPAAQASSATRGAAAARSREDQGASAAAVYASPAGRRLFHLDPDVCHVMETPPAVLLQAPAQQQLERGPAGLGQGAPVRLAGENR